MKCRYASVRGHLWADRSRYLHSIFCDSSVTAGGFVTLAPDATRFRDRRDTTFEKEEIRDWKEYAFLSERKLATALLLRRQTLRGVMTWEHMRAVDILKSMDFVNPKQIGCLGMSIGGMQSFRLTVMDDRIACGTEACGVSSFRIWAEKQTPNAAIQTIHSLRGAYLYKTAH